MNDTLFDIPETLSPKLAWCRKHNIATFSNAPDGDGNWTAQMWIAADCGEPVQIRKTAPTEDEALIALAKSAGIKLWMEE